MELNPIEDVFDRVTKKQKLSSCKTQEVLDQLNQEIDKMLSKLTTSRDPSSEYGTILAELKTKVNDIAPFSQLEGVQKELNTALSKYQKVLEKSFYTDISKAYRNMDPDLHTANQIITSHFYREGLFDVGDCFVNEVNDTEANAMSTPFQEANAMRAPFQEMYQMLYAMRTGDLEPALAWAATNRENLAKNGSDLELKLHRLQFVEIVQNRSRNEALEYARRFLSPFASSHIAEVQKLATCLLWAGKLETSPYSELLSSTHWENLAEDFIRQFCNILGQSYKSPLSVTISAGFQGLPTLLKMMNVMIRNKHEWQSMKQLPVPMDLDKEFQFHSVFVCPVSREPASDENPPMLLSCGHVLCKQSIMKLSKNNSTRPFKCPYCPFEVEAAKCCQLYL